MGEAATWDSLGYAHHQLGQHDQARDCYQHALPMFHDLGDRFEEADVLTHLGDSCRAAGDVEAAADAWRRALAILDDLGHPDAVDVRVRLTTPLV